jgi:16S rRNA A1518/A1519 N6-dimethyltransferase RsmA/KsgA/DIM1 with predicted DNA glycosylase/AP lyase activity
MLSLLPSLEKGLVMVQAEVADRLAAAPGSKVYGVPSVKAAWYADVRRAGTVETESIVMRASSGTVRRVKGEHRKGSI